MLKTIYSGSGQISTISLSSYANTLTPDDNSVCASGNIVVGQQVTYDPHQAPQFQHIYTKHKGYISFNTSSIAGYINSGMRVYSASLFLTPSTIGYDIPYALTFKTSNNHITPVESGWELLNVDPDSLSFTSDMQDDWLYNTNTPMFSYNISGWSISSTQKLTFPPYWINPNGLTQIKLSTNRVDANNNSGWNSTQSWNETVYFFGANYSQPLLTPHLIIGFAGMRYLRLTDLSLIYCFKNAIDIDPTTSGIVTVMDAFPEDPETIDLPTISVDHIISEIEPIQISKETNRLWSRDFAVDIFARTKGELDDLTEKVYLLLNDTTPLYDYNSGFPEDGYSPNRIGTIFFSNVEVSRVEPNHEFPQTKYHSVVFLNAKTYILDPKLDLLNVRIDL